MAVPAHDRIQPADHDARSGPRSRATTALATLGRPLAVLAVILGLIAYLLEPMLPDWARENRGVIGKSILCAIAIGIAPDIIGFFLA